MTSGASPRHPLFARIYAWASPRAEDTGQGEHRQELLSGLSGRVVEVGAGNGLNFRHYPASVDEVLAVEPEPYLRERAQESAAASAVAVTVLDGLAERLPLEDQSVDAGVLSLVLCSVTSQKRALAELRRVLRPGGEVRFYEHVRSERPGFARFQRAVDLVWPRLSGGCHTHRDTLGAMAEAGFEIEAYRRFSFLPCPLVAPAAPHVLGRARRP